MKNIIASILISGTVLAGYASAIDVSDFPSMDAAGLDKFALSESYSLISSDSDPVRVYFKEDGDNKHYMLVEMSGYDIIDMRLLSHDDSSIGKKKKSLVERYGEPVLHADIIKEVVDHNHAYKKLTLQHFEPYCQKSPVPNDVQEFCAKIDDPIALNALLKNKLQGADIPHFYCQQIGEKTNSPLFHGDECLLELVYLEELKNGKDTFNRSPLLPPATNSLLSVEESSDGHASFGLFGAIVWNTGDEFVTYQYQTGAYAGLKGKSDEGLSFHVVRIHPLSKTVLSTQVELDGFTLTKTGLKYRIVSGDNSGPKPTMDSTVTVHYEGRLKDGTKFDSSLDRGQPATFPLNSVILGWQEGVGLMGVGDKFTFEIPPALGYGEQTVGQIPANSTLVFDVELIDIVE